MTLLGLCSLAVLRRLFCLLAARCPGLFLQFLPLGGDSLPGDHMPGAPRSHPEHGR